MRTLSSLVAVVSLFLTAALSPAIGGVVFAMLFFAVFALALVGVLAGVEDRTVRQHKPPMSPTKWRDG